MRLFQNSGSYPSYMRRLDRLSKGAATFEQRLAVFLGDRYGASHFLMPVLDGDPLAFFTNGDDEALQRMWAREMGLPAKTKLEAILLAQIEAHRTDVFYNMDPMRYGSAFVRKLPSCVKRTVCWRAAPSQGGDFLEYGLLVNNFPSILAAYAKLGMRTAYFAPAHDPEMDAYAANTTRPIDVLFAGGYSRHHRNRAQVLEAVAALHDQFKVVFCLDRSRLTRLAESELGQMLPLRRHRRPVEIQSVSADPVFGRDLYAQLAQAKIVLNGAVDMAGADRGNMRCFEAMGCGCALLSDEGSYPEGMEPGVSLAAYTCPENAVEKLHALLGDREALRSLATTGHQMIARRYSKQRQWEEFVALVH